MFEISEQVEMRYDDVTSRYARVGPAPAAKPSRQQGPAARSYRKWMPSGRLGLHAYAPDPEVIWEQYWREKVAGDLSKSFGAIAKALEQAAPLLVKLKAEAEREAEERRKQWEAERLEAARKDAERRRVEQDKQRLVELKEQLERWKFTRETRALVEEVREMAASRGLRIKAGGPVEEWLNWVLQKADEADPLAIQRRHVDEVAREFGTLDRRRSPLAARLRLRRARRDR